MDRMIYFSECFTHVLNNANRHFNTAANVWITGYMPYKSSMVDYIFDSFNFSFILHGRGTYQYGEEAAVEISAPCVITQWPGAKMYYGPLPDESWQELYLIYDKNQIGKLKESGLYNEECRWWTVKNKRAFYQSIDHFLHTVNSPIEQVDADLIDQLSQICVSQSMLPERQSHDKKENRIQTIKRLVDSNCTLEFDFDNLAVANEMSPSFFRKLWKQQLGMTPMNYVTQKRMELARMLLLQSDEPIADIAVEVGYSDPLYFSRVFSRYHNASPRSFRRSISGTPLPSHGREK